MRWRHQLMYFAATVCFFMLSSSATHAQEGTAGSKSTREAQGARFLRGAIDMHYHMDAPTSITPGADIAKVRVARSLGLRGLVLKAHQESTATLAYQIRHEMPG